MIEVNPKPTAGIIYTNGKLNVKVKSFTHVIEVEILDTEGQLKSNRTWTYGEWNDKHFNESNHDDSPSTVNERKTNAEDVSARFFKYDDQNQEIVILDSAGIEIGRMKGLYGPTGQSFYEVWTKHHKKDPENPETWKEFETAFKGRDGVSTNGIDGKNAFEVWAARQEKGKDSFDLFMQSLRGEPGKDGYDGQDAFETWKETQPEDHSSKQDFRNFMAGKCGKNGESAYELWLRLYPHDGQVTEEDFFRWIAKQVPAVDGATFIPSIDTDGKLYFTNSRTHERTKVHHNVKGKDGKTFHPVIHDNNLWFEDENGEIYGQKVQIKGDTGNEGPRGKSAYELWRNDPLHPENANKTLDDYRRSLKGEDGHNVTATHDYLKDLKDYTCPIESINPHMIVSTNSLQGADSAEQTIEQEKAKINNLRHEGEEYHNHGSWIQEFFWWCAGADRPLLRMCPVEHSKYMGIGTVIFFTALMAWLSSFIALGLVTGESSNPKPIHGVLLPAAILIIGSILGFLLYKQFRMKRLLDHAENLQENREQERVLGKTYKSLKRWTVKSGVLLGLSLVILATTFINHGATFKDISWAAVFACAWSLMIFFLDRFITNTMYSDGRVTISWLELRSALPRIIIAIFLGIVISAPLELKIFEKEVTNNIYNVQKPANRADAEAYFSRSINEIKDSLKWCNNQLQNADINANRVVFFYNEIEKQEEKAIKEVNNVNSRYKANIVDYNQRLTESDEARRERINRELTGDKERNDKISKEKLLARQPYDDRISELQDSIRLYTNLSPEYLKELQQVLTCALDSINDLKTDSINAINTEFDKNIGLHTQLKALHSLAFQEEKEDGYTKWPEDKWYLSWWFWALCIFILLSIVSSPFLKNVIPVDNYNQDKGLNQQQEREYIKQVDRIRSYKGGRVVFPWLAVIAIICGACNEMLFHALPYYIFSAVGLIMMLFILIDVSPVFYKMMLADGIYDKLLHKEKLLAEDAIRLNAAKAYANVTNSDIGRLAPFVFGKTSEKLNQFLGPKIILKSDKVEYEDDKKRKKEGKPELAWGSNYYTEVIDEQNRETFDYVLLLKKRLVETAYLAWYRDSRDSILGMVEHKDDPGKPEDMFTELDDTLEPNIPPVTEESMEKESGNSTTEDNLHVDPEHNSEKSASEPETETKAEENSETNTQTEDNTEAENSEEKEHIVDEDGNPIKSTSEKSSSDSTSTDDDDNEHEIKSDKTFTTK